MRRVILDTSVLVRHWRKCIGDSLEDKKPADAVRWANQLVEIEDTDAILSPISIEMLAGVSSQHELRLTRAFLRRFRIVDGGQILAEDWVESRKLAERIPRDGKPRHLGDCLIQALANRLKYQVRTFDKRFTR
ncbi:MAG: type II toxin-antitoxin system VapC family toxin [Planctomycetes bacterium]|nr:type II toxin-antitoxin system VapC family toxin [Planctomycetota bacterium]